MADMKLLVKGEHKLGESALWHESAKRWFWVDLYEPMLCSFDPATKQSTRRSIDLPAPIGSVVATSDPDVLLISHRGGISWLALKDLSLRLFANPEQGRAEVISNDMKVDRWGRLWLATSHDKEQQPRGALWCVENSARFHLADVGFAIGNGPAFSPDGKILYFSDSYNAQILAYDISLQDGQVRDRRVFAQFSAGEGLPDGLTVDAAGNLWSAQWAGASIFKLAPTGEKLQRIPVPSSHVTSVAFHGCSLLITTARDGLSAEQLAQYPLSGSVFAYETSEEGVVEKLFQV